MSALIQSLGGYQKGNFELVIVRNGELQHWFRDNDDPKLPWYQGNGGKPVIKPGQFGYDRPSLIQNKFGPQGNFEALVASLLYPEMFVTILSR